LQKRIIQVRTETQYLFLLIAPNGCTADVPPRWAFVCGRLRRYVRQCGVGCWLFFIFLFFLFFLFFYTRNLAVYVRNSNWLPPQYFVDFQGFTIFNV
jgi:hypothetical protein